MNNYAKDSAGAFLIDFYGSGSLINSIFNGSRADSNGGAISVPDKAVVKIINVTFENNSAPVGGALSIINTPTITISDCRFLRNQANDGAAIYLSNSGAPLIIVNTVFNGNIAQSYVFSIVSGLATVNYLTVTNSLNGFLAASASTITITNSTV